MELYKHQIDGLEKSKDLNHVAIKGYEGLYEIDSNGNVYSLRNGLILKSYSNGIGYMKVNLYDQNGHCKKKYVHRLVAESFIPNPNNLQEVNHIDCNKQNCNVNNLEWCDRKSNLQHSYEHGLKRTCESHGCSKLNWNAIHDIRTKVMPQKEYAKKYGIAQCTVSAIQLNKLWKERDVNAVVSTSD